MEKKEAEAETAAQKKACTLIHARTPTHAHACMQTEEAAAARKKAEEEEEVMKMARFHTCPHACFDARSHEHAEEEAAARKKAEQEAEAEKGYTHTLAHAHSLSSTHVRDHACMYAQLGGGGAEEARGVGGCCKKTGVHALLCFGLACLVCSWMCASVHTISPSMHICTSRRRLKHRGSERRKRRGGRRRRMRHGRRSAFTHVHACSYACTRLQAEKQVEKAAAKKKAEAETAARKKAHTLMLGYALTHIHTQRACRQRRLLLRGRRLKRMRQHGRRYAFCHARVRTPIDEHTWQVEAAAVRKKAEDYEATRKMARYRGLQSEKGRVVEGIEARSKKPDDEARSSHDDDAGPMWCWIRGGPIGSNAPRPRPATRSNNDMKRALPVRRSPKTASSTQHVAGSWARHRGDRVDPAGR